MCERCELTLKKKLAVVLEHQEKIDEVHFWLDLAEEFERLQYTAFSDFERHTIDQMLEAAYNFEMARNRMSDLVGVFCSDQQIKL